MESDLPDNNVEIASKLSCNVEKWPLVASSDKFFIESAWLIISFFTVSVAFSEDNLVSSFSLAIAAIVVSPSLLIFSALFDSSSFSCAKSFCELSFNKLSSFRSLTN
jgi:hypothetical protein